MTASEYSLTKDQASSYHRDGYLKLTDFLSAQQAQQLVQEIRQIQSWPDTPGKWMNYYERLPGTDQLLLCRTENFTPYNTFVHNLVSGARTMNLLEQLTGQPYVLFKEKINAKLPGGQGFKPHQDAPAFTHLGQNQHLTVLFTVDGSYRENGCLEVVPGSHATKTVIPHLEDGCLVDEWCENHEWMPVECDSGDVLVFDSYLAHRSGENKSQTSRANLYMTYNPLSEGDKREEYYADKRIKFPPLSEREAGKCYKAGARTYNFANPII